MEVFMYFLVFVYLIAPTYTACTGQAALGDVILEQHKGNDPVYKGIVKICLQNPETGVPTWGTMCNNNLYSKTVSQVICHQLGYEGIHANWSGVSRNVSNITGPRWLQSIACTDSSQLHILRCNYILNTTDSHILCPDDEDLIVNCNDADLIEGHEGAVRLCRHNLADVPSYGILLTWHKGEWGYINNNPSTIQFGSFESDTVCRQLGYTQTVPGSVQRVTSGMEKCGNIEDKYLNVSAVRCTSRSACLGCCYDPSDSECRDCSLKNNIVLQCMFDQSIRDRENIPSAGSTQLCQVSNQRLHNAACAGGEHTESQNWKISTYSLTGLLGLIILVPVIVVFVYGCSKLIRRIRRPGYQHLGHGDGNDNGAHVPGGQQLRDQQ